MTACESVCVRVKCSLSPSTCLSNELALQQNVRQDRKFQAQIDLQCLSKMHRCVELWSIECVRDKVHDTDSDYVMRKPPRCWLGAVLRYWNVVASAVFVSLVLLKTPLLPLLQEQVFLNRFSYSFFCFLALEFVYKTLPQSFFIRSQNLVAFERRQK